MFDLRARLPAQTLMQKTLELHPAGSPRPPQDLSWYIGAIGEIAVAGILSQLDETWTVLHSVPVGEHSADIDHVLIGPAGVFTINTKNHTGQNVWIGGYGLLVSGKSTRYIAAAAEEAEDAAERLSMKCGMAVPVTPLIVLMDPGPVTVKAAPERGVEVLADTALLARLHDRDVFSKEQVSAIAAAAAQSTTWTRRANLLTDTATLALRFNAMLARSAQGPSVRSLPQTATSQPRPRTSHAPASRPAKAPSASTRRPRRKSGPLDGLIGSILGLLTFIWFVYGFLLPQLQAASH